MTYLVGKRICNEEIVAVLVAEMSQTAAAQKLSELATFPGQVSTVEGGDAHGELWFEIEAELDGDIISDPVCFASEHAHATLVRTGLSDAQATLALSDDNAAAILKALYSV